jgi:hypothetical protein
MKQRPSRGFAMANGVQAGPDDPLLCDYSVSGSEWLVVHRWGDFGEFIEISGHFFDQPTFDPLTARPSKLPTQQG